MIDRIEDECFNLMVSFLPFCGVLSPISKYFQKRVEPIRRKTLLTSLIIKFRSKIQVDLPPMNFIIPIASSKTNFSFQSDAWKAYFQDLKPKSNGPRHWVYHIVGVKGLEMTVEFNGMQLFCEADLCFADCVYPLFIGTAINPSEIDELDCGQATIRIFPTDTILVRPDEAPEIYAQGIHFETMTVPEGVGGWPIEEASPKRFWEQLLMVQSHLHADIIYDAFEDYVDVENDSLWDSVYDVSWIITKFLL